MTNIYPDLVGIDDIALYLPKIYLPIQDLADLRNIEYAKLNKGLGLEKMSFCDQDEDVATMGAEAAWNLFERNDLQPAQIGRIYLGTESALDGAKPTATYIVEMLEMKLGKGALGHCDVVDMTFACIGAVDALQNCLDWIRVHPEQQAIVIASDNARYELGSTGEYTQGAGAVAMLVKSQPRLLSFDKTFGVSTSSVHDFFKPNRKISITSLNGQSEEVFGSDYSPNDKFVYLHKITPVFDGQYSNECYQKRVEDAFRHYCSLSDDDASLLDRWHQMVFHLPYAFHAKRICQPLFVDLLIAQGRLNQFCREEGLDLDQLADDTASFYKALAKTAAYTKFVEQKLTKGARASSLTGNLYTASIFLSLMSALTELLHGEDPQGETIAFFAYGSGSKSKVFTARIMAQWKEVTSTMSLHQILEERTPISAETYQALHGEHLTQSVYPNGRTFFVSQKSGEGYLKHASFYEVG